MFLSVVIPVFNRLENLKLCLAALEQQAYKEFEVIVVDDGSTDDVASWILDRYNSEEFEQRGGAVLASARGKSGTQFITVFSGGPNKGFRGGRARNIGAFNSFGDAVVFIDSDIVVSPIALEKYNKALEYHQNKVVIVGQYHWLPPLVITEEDVRNRFGLIENAELPKLEGAPNDSPFGLDVRHSDFVDGLSETRKGAGLGCLSGNIAYPLWLFKEVGGFDEAIIGHGGEDADLGLTVAERGTDFLFYKPIVGYHIWHSRDQKKNYIEVQRNIAYIDRKHGIGKYREAKKWTDSQDWAHWSHYKKDLGAVLIQAIGDQTVYAVRDLHRLGLTTPDWIKSLGFNSDEIVEVPTYGFDGIVVEGATPSWSLELFQN